MRPIRFWFNGGYADFQVPEGADDRFEGSALRLDGPSGPVLRISILRTRPAREGGPATAEEALRLTRFVDAGTLEALPQNRAVFSHVVPAADGNEDLVAHVWHLAVPGPDASILVAIFALMLHAKDAAAAEPTIKAVASEVRTARFLFFDQPETAEAPDVEDA
ncbi:MAG: hypothetical protein AAB434_04000 [Planctomycetota bacterium]